MSHSASSRRLPLLRFVAVLATAGLVASSPETLARQFVLRDSTRVDLGVPPGYLLVLPVGDEA